jgi:hypothetical protein
MTGQEREPLERRAAEAELRAVDFYGESWQVRAERAEAALVASEEPAEGDGPCLDCGGSNLLGGTYWFADNALWNEIMPNKSGILCAPCFTRRCESQGVGIGWRAGRVGDLEALVAAREDTERPDDLLDRLAKLGHVRVFSNPHDVGKWCVEIRTSSYWGDSSREALENALAGARDTEQEQER